MVSSIFKGEQALGEPQQAGPVEAEADRQNRNMNKVLFNQRSLFKQPQGSSPDMRIIFEL